MELVGFLFLSESVSWDDVQKFSIKHGLFMFRDESGDTILLSRVFLPRLGKENSS